MNLKLFFKFESLCQLKKKVGDKEEPFKVLRKSSNEFIISHYRMS